MQLAFEFTMAALMAGTSTIQAIPTSDTVNMAFQPLQHDQGRNPADGGKSCRFVLRAIDERARSLWVKGTRFADIRDRLLIGSCDDEDAIAIIYQAAKYRADYVSRTRRRRTPRQIVWNGETIEV